MTSWQAVDQCNPERFQRNLDALERFHPALFQSAVDCLASVSLAARLNPQGTFDIAETINGERQPILDGGQIAGQPKKCAAQLQELSPPHRPSLIYCIGFDGGVSFDLLYQHFRASDRKYIIVVEPDMRLFAAGLGLVDLNAAFSSKQALWLIGNDGLANLPTAIEENHLFALNSVEVYFGGPLPAGSPLPKQVQAASQNAMRIANQRFLQDMAETKAYYAGKPPDQIQKIMAVDIREGMAVRFIQRRFLDECETQGIEVSYFEPSGIGGVAYLRAITRQRPDLLFFMNWHPAEYAPIQALNQFRLPRVTWCIDDPYSFLKDKHLFYQNDFVWTWDAAYQDCYAARLAQSIDHVPYVADFDHIESKTRESFLSPVSYVGQAGALDAKALQLDEATERLVRKVGEAKANQLDRSYASLTLEFQHEFGLRLIEHEGRELAPNVRYGMYVVGNALRRIAVLERARPFGLKLYGNREWEAVLGDHPLRECYQGPADPERDVPDIFRSSQINLNIHSIQALTSLNQRDFNCPLSGGFLLTDWVEGCDALFAPGEELVFYSTLDDLEEKLGYYLSHPAERERVIENGKRRVLKDHTYPALVPRAMRRLKSRIQERFSS